MSLLAVNAGEMRVALTLATVVGQFKMRGSVVQIGLMYQIFIEKLCQCAIDGCLVRSIGTDLLSDLLLREQGVGFQ